MVINYDTNTITVADSQTWTQGDGVHLTKYYDGINVSIGAYGYPTTGYRKVKLTKTGDGQGNIYSNDAQFLCGPLCKQDYVVYKVGETVKLIADENAGLGTFGGWSGSGCSGTETCTVTVSAGEGDIEIGATWKP